MDFSTTSMMSAIHLDGTLVRMRIDLRELALGLVGAHQFVGTAHVRHHGIDGTRGQLRIRGPELHGHAGPHDGLLPLEPLGTSRRCGQLQGNDKAEELEHRAGTSICSVDNRRRAWRWPAPSSTRAQGRHGACASANRRCRNARTAGCASSATISRSLTSTAAISRSVRRPSTSDATNACTRIESTLLSTCAQPRHRQVVVLEPVGHDAMRAGAPRPWFRPRR